MATCVRPPKIDLPRSTENSLRLPSKYSARRARSIPTFGSAMDPLGHARIRNRTIFLSHPDWKFPSRTPFPVRSGAERQAPPHSDEREKWEAAALCGAHGVHSGMSAAARFLKPQSSTECSLSTSQLQPTLAASARAFWCLGWSLASRQLIVFSNFGWKEFIHFNQQIHVSFVEQFGFSFF